MPAPIRVDYKETNLFDRAMKEYKEREDYAKAHAFFAEVSLNKIIPCCAMCAIFFCVFTFGPTLEQMLRSVEIYWQKHIERVLFMVPPQCKFFTEEARERTKAATDFSSEERIRHFVGSSQVMNWKGTG